MDVNKIQVGDPPYIRLFIIILFFSIGIYFLKAQMQIQEISRNWPKHRCKPHIMPFASLYGHNTVDNFNYCLSNIFGEQSANVVAPFFKILSSFGGILGVLLGSINNLRLQGATLFGGITQIFTEFTARMAQMILKVNTTFIRMRQLMFRVQTTMFAILYMGLSAMNAALSFGDTTLFKFLDTFCFPPDTPIGVIMVDSQVVMKIPIEQIYVGQRLANGKTITSRFEFDVVDQPMVLLGDDVRVSANHYVFYEKLGTFVKAKDHPDSIEAAPYTGKLICLNCEGNRFQIGNYTFLDYDETPTGDAATMSWIESCLNGGESEKEQADFDYTTVVAGSTRVKLADDGLVVESSIPISEIPLGMELAKGKVIGRVQKVVNEICITEHGTQITPANLIWDSASERWIRAGTKYPILKLGAPRIFYSLIVTGATIELETGEYIRDYVEIHSPDSEQFYSAAIKSI